MEQTLVTVSFFDDTELDTLAQEILDLHVGIEDDTAKAHKLMANAMYRRWTMGKLIYDNQDRIKELCGTQKEFAEKMGLSEATISNNKRGYSVLKDAGATTWEQVVSLLNSKNLQANTYTFERMGKLLANPEPTATPKEHRPKDERRLEQLQSEIEEIIERNEHSNTTVASIGKDVLSFAVQGKEYFDSQDVYNSTWRNKKYLAAVRNLGYCCVTGEACNPDPHHVIPSQAQTVGRKVADVFVIPVSRQTHELLECGAIELTEEEVTRYLMETMANVITQSE